MPRFNWNDLDPTKDFNDGSPNQGLIWGSLWAQQRSFRLEQTLWLKGDTSSSVTSSSFSGSPIVTEKVSIPKGVEEVSVMTWGRGAGAGGSTSRFQLRLILFLDGSNEWPLLWLPDETDRGQARTEMESDILEPFNVGGITPWNEAGYEGPGLATNLIGIDQDTDPDTEVSTDTIESFLPAEFEIRLDARRDSGTGTGTFQIRALLLQQRGAYYIDTKNETLFIP